MPEIDYSAIEKTLDGNSQPVGQGADYAAIEKLLDEKGLLVREAGAFDGIGRQLGLTAREAAQGAAGTLGIAYDPIATIMNWTIGTNIKPLRDQVKQALTEIGVPEPETAVERIVAAVSEGLTGAGGQAALARMATPPITQAATTLAAQLAAQPGAQMAGGAAAGGAAQTAAELGGGPGAQLAAGLAGGIVGGRGAGIETRARPADLPQAVREAEEAGVRVLTTDVARPETFFGRWAQRTGEMIPIVGTGPVRAAQQRERVEAARDLLRRYGVQDTSFVGDDTISRISADLLGRRLERINKYTNMKDEVISRLSGQGTVDLSRTIAKIDEQIANIERLSPSGQRDAVANVLREWRTDLLNLRDIELPDGTVQTVAQGRSLDEIEELRKWIGEQFKDPNLASVRNFGEKVLSSIYAPLREDMGDFVRAVGKRRDYDKWNVANRQLSKMLGELENKSLKSALEKGKITPESVQSLLFSSKPSDVQMLYRNLSSGGKSIAKMGVLQRALFNSGGNFENLSPDRLKNNIEKLGKPIGVLFSGPELQAIEGLLRTLKMTARAGEAAVSPPTGLQAVPVVGAAFLTDLFGGVGSAMVSGITMGGLARAYESTAVRNLLMKIPQVAVGSPEEAELIKRVTATMRAKASVEDRPEKKQ